MDNTTPQKKSKLKLIVIIVAIALIVIGVGVATVLLLNKPKEEDGQPVVNDKNSDMLQIYAKLDNEIALDDVHSVVKNINAETTIEVGDGYGTIKMSGAGDFISFYFETEEDEEEPEEVSYALNVAHDFTYVLPIDEEDDITISCADVCYYYDGIESYEYSDKQEAIKAYLNSYIGDDENN